MSQNKVSLLPACPTCQGVRRVPTYELSPPLGPRLCSLYRLNVVVTEPPPSADEYMRASPLKNSSCDRRTIVKQAAVNTATRGLFAVGCVSQPAADHRQSKCTKTPQKTFRNERKNEKKNISFYVVSCAFLLPSANNGTFSAYSACEASHVEGRKRLSSCFPFTAASTVRSTPSLPHSLTSDRLAWLAAATLAKRVGRSLVVPQATHPVE